MFPRFILLSVLAALIPIGAAISHPSAHKTDPDSINLKGSSFFEPKIVNGVEAEIEEYYWQVSVGFSSPNFSNLHICGGTIIGEFWVLTAAHCIAEPPYEATTPVYLTKDKMAIYNGFTSMVGLSGEDGTEIEEIIVHPGAKPEAFDNDNGVIWRDDIALIKTKSTLWLDHNAGLPKVHLAGSGDDNIDNLGTLKISGYGLTELNLKDLRLRAAEIEPVSNDICNDTFSQNGTVDEKMICAGIPGGGQTCSADSGGPLVKHHNVSESPVLIGVTSWGDARCYLSEKHSVFVRVSKYRDWICGIIENCTAQ